MIKDQEHTEEQKLAALNDAITRHLWDVAELFTEPVKLTMVVRNPAHADGSRDVVVTDDDAESVCAVIRQRFAASAVAERAGETL